MIPLRLTATEIDLHKDANPEHRMLICIICLVVLISEFDSWLGCCKQHPDIKEY